MEPDSGMIKVLGRAYLFQKLHWAIIQALIDSFGYAVFRKSGKGQIPREIKKILVSRIDHLGDVFIASSILPYLKKAYPLAKIDFMAGEWARDLLKSTPNIDKILMFNLAPLNRTGGKVGKIFKALMGFFKNMINMRKEPYDIAIDLRAYPLNSIPLIYMGNARYKLGFATGGFGFFLDRIVAYRSGVHETEHIRDILTSLGIDTPEGSIRPQFFLAKPAFNEGIKALNESGVANGDEFILIHTGSGTTSKLWKKERWQELINRISKLYCIKLLVYDNIYGNLMSCVKLPSSMSFESFAVAAKKTTLFIGLDSFPAHLAASFDTSVIVIWCGINDLKQWRQLGKSVRILKRDLECSPCYNINGCGTMDCMDITVDDCLKEVDRHLKDRKILSQV